MPEDEQPPRAEQPTGRPRKPWFARNRGGMGYHPVGWQGVLIVAAAVAVIVAVVVLLRTGVL